MDLTFQEREAVRAVIEGFTYHQKYRLYVKLAKDLKEDDEFVALLKKPKPPKGVYIIEGKGVKGMRKG